MKKVSTAAIKPSRNISRQTLTVGLDLGDRNSWYCVLDEAGHIQVEQRVGTNAKALGEVFGAMPCSRIALETGTHSPWISRLSTSAAVRFASGKPNAPTLTSFIAIHQNVFLRNHLGFRCVNPATATGEAITTKISQQSYKENL